MARLIDADKLFPYGSVPFYQDDGFRTADRIYGIIKNAPTVNAYTAHDVAEILADVFGDACACNFNGNDEWLPEKCELLDACPYPVGVACWEQWLKHRNAKKDGEDHGKEYNCTWTEGSV